MLSKARLEQGVMQSCKIRTWKRLRMWPQVKKRLRIIARSKRKNNGQIAKKQNLMRHWKSMEKTGKRLQNISVLNLTVKFVITRTTWKKTWRRIRNKRISTYWKFLMVSKFSRKIKENQIILRMSYLAKKKLLR